MSTRLVVSTVSCACAVTLALACSRDSSSRAPAPSAAPSPVAKEAPPAAATIPITTASAPARAAYQEGTALQLALRATDAHAKFEQAVAADPSLALAHLGLATTAATNDAFFAELDRAVALAAGASEPERLWITGVAAGAKGDPAGQLVAYRRLVELAPGDPQALQLLGNAQFGRQEYPAAIDTFTKVIALDPKFTAAYNQLGYAYRFVGDLDGAQRTFEKYIELLPGDPNPYDSYGELLMKRGKFDESIASYRKALAVDPNFVASWVGIGNDHMFAGRGDDARAAFAELAKVARNPGEERQAVFWTAVSYLHEGRWTEALAACDRERAIAVRIGDLGLEAQDHNMRAYVLLAAGKPEAAEAEIASQVELVERAKLPDEVKAQVRRNAHYDRARIALARHDLATAKARHADFATEVAATKRPFEVQLVHQLAGAIAIEERRFTDAVGELEQANPQDPRALYELGVAYAGAGDKAKARAALTTAAEWNALAINYAYVRAPARRALAALGAS